MIIGSSIIILISYNSTSHEVNELFDAQLTQVSRVLNSLIELHQSIGDISNPTVIPGWISNETFEEGHKATKLGHEYERKIAFQVWDENETLIIRSESAPNTPFSNFKPGYKNINIDKQLYKAIK